MLVLSRLPEEEIIIGGPGWPDQLILKILDIKNGRVRIGFLNASGVPIHRAEVYLEIHGHLPEGSSHGRNTK